MIISVRFIFIAMLSKKQIFFDSIVPFYKNKYYLCKRDDFYYDGNHKYKLNNGLMKNTNRIGADVLLTDLNQDIKS